MSPRGPRAARRARRRRRSTQGRLARGPERVLPFACVASAIALFASEFMTTFRLAQAGGDTLCAQEAADRHHYALAVLAAFAVVAVIVAVVSGSKPAAISVAVIGVLALLMFLIVDLPKVNNVGTLAGCSTTTAGEFFEAKALPQSGFWLEMAGALALTLSGAALATLSSDQLRAIRPRWLGGGGEPRSAGAAAETEQVKDAG